MIIHIFFSSVVFTEVFIFKDLQATCYRLLLLLFYVALHAHTYTRMCVCVYFVHFKLQF